MIVRRYWEPFQEMDALRRQLDRVFDDLNSTTEAASTTWTPTVRLIDTGDNYQLMAQLPGVNPDDIDIQVSREAIAISGHRSAPDTAEGEQVLFDDIRYGTFRRVLNLPEAVQNDQVHAEYSHGLLTLTLPKVEEARNRVVKINLGELNGSKQPAIEAESADSHAEANAS